MEYIPLQAAAKKYGIEENVLTQLISVGMIETKTVSGGVLVAIDKNGSVGQADEEPQTKEEIIAAKFGDLIGQPITLSQAAEKYHVPRDTLKTWKNINRYISPIFEDSYPACFDESQIAYLADIYHQRKNKGTGFYGAPLLNDDGLPYKLKLPDLAKYRRKKKAMD